MVLIPLYMDHSRMSQKMTPKTLLHIHVYMQAGVWVLLLSINNQKSRSFRLCCDREVSANAAIMQLPLQPTLLCCHCAATSCTVAATAVMWRRVVLNKLL